jgi:GntR family transcriptional regulator/MocR family aminotransferase
MSLQLFDALRAAVLNGALAAGARMPSSRALADDLGVSRTTVLQAYEQLKAEGYLEGREKSGTFVRATIPDRTAWRHEQAHPVIDRPEALPVRLSGRLAALNVNRRDGAVLSLPLNPGIPAIREFPAQQFSRLYRPAALRPGPSGHARCPPEGTAELRDQVLSYLRSSRGVSCDLDQLFIVSGTRQALHVVLMALSNPGDGAWSEDPGYPGALTAYGIHRMTAVSVPVDAEGLIVSAGRRRRDDARFAYVTPARQAPLGHTMSIGRRIELLNWAYERDALILEDDYDGEYRFGGYPSPSLQSLDPDGRVVYFGTFSKTLLPALGIGYLVVPRRYVKAVSYVLDAVARPPGMMTQIAVADFMASGGFEAHVRRMRTLYRQRQEALAVAVEAHAGDLLRVETLNAGLHLIGWLPDGLNDHDVKAQAVRHGLRPRALSEFTFTETMPPALMLGFADLRAQEVDGAVRKLRRAVEAALSTDPNKPGSAK